MSARVERLPTPESLADAVATALVAKLASISSPRIVLTGGSIAEMIHAAVAAHPDRTSVAWDTVEVWYGDERYVARDDPERNALQARKSMLDHLPVDPARLHEMPAADGGHGDDVETAALAYGAELLSSVPTEGPWFDVLMLGIGPDGHCASLFPGRPEVLDPAPVLAVRRSPKPPPTRISLGMSTLNRAREVWFVAASAEKAEAVARAVNGADMLDVPAAGPRGTEETVWYLDEAAAWML